MYKNKLGFTLLELLVVILIIGILSAIALPQYNKAVEKSRQSEAAELLHSIYQAEQNYYLMHNNYAEDFDNLDIELPSVLIEDDDGQVLITKNFIISLKDANKTYTFAKAIRKKGSESVYGIYKNLVTGENSCEDLNTNDKIGCSDFGFDGEVYTCSNGSISSSGCSDESTCPENCTCDESGNVIMCTIMFVTCPVDCECDSAGNILYCNTYETGCFDCGDGTITCAHIGQDCSAPLDM